MDPDRRRRGPLGPGGIAVAYARRLIHALGFACVLVFGAELAARLDDWIRHDVPLLSSPDRDRDLMVAEPWGFRGRPHGHFRKWQLDASGFRLTPATVDEPILLILGASETFGLYESPDKDYPAQLVRLLQHKQPCRVVNASIAGISLTSMIVYWDNWAGNFHADQVLIYPSPHLYLDNESPHLPDNPQAIEAEQRRTALRPRLLQRVKDLYHQLPAWMQKYREEWVIRQETAGESADWFFRQVPEDRLRQFEDDLSRLVAHVRERSAEPILVTHAISAASPPRPEDQTYLRRMRMYYPRATPETLVAFEQQANDGIRRLAKREHLSLIDADRTLSSRSELFADLVHFNDEGATKMAELLAEHLPPFRRPDALTKRK